MGKMGSVPGESAVQGPPRRHPGDEGVELRAEGATQVGDPGGGVEGYGGLDTAEEGERVGAEREAEGGEEERGKEARVAVAAAGRPPPARVLPSRLRPFAVA